jgi:protein translocase SEC61 complex gamma subunit
MGIGSFARESFRIINVATKPKQREFERIVKITGAGIILVGLAGVIIMMVLKLASS